MQKQSVIEEYFSYYDENAKKLGQKTIVFMKVGSFYEAYATENKGYDLTEISKLINVIRTKKNNKDPTVSIKNPFMLGFPTVSLAERLHILTDNGFSVVIIDQIFDENNKIHRMISGIYTPGTNIMSYTPDSNYLISIYIKEEKQIKSNPILVSGMSACDITTGKIYIYEATSTCEDEKFSLDETMRFIRAYYPKEILIYCNIEKNKTDAVESYLELDNFQIKKIQTINEIFHKISYQLETIKTIYPSHGIQNPIEYIGMERYNYSMISFMILLDYINNINKCVLKKLHIPKKFCKQPTLYLGNNPQMQLSIVPNNQLETYKKNITSLLDVVDNTCTSMGKRYLKSKLNSPMVDISELNNIYDITELLCSKIENKEKSVYLYQEYTNILSSVGDIEKIFRKMILEIVDAKEFYSFVTSLTAVNQILNKIKEHPKLNKLIKYSSNVSEINNLLEYCNKVFNIDKLKTSNDECSFYNKHYHVEIDKLYEQLNDRINFIENLRHQLAQIIGNEKGITTKKNDRDGYYYAITKARCATLREKLKTMKKIKIGSIEIDTDTIIIKPNPVGINKIIVHEVDTNTDNIVSLKNTIHKSLKQLFVDDLNYIINNYNMCIRNIIILISKIDYYVSNAKSSIKNHYSKPVIEQCDYGFVKCKKLRHPIIEKIIDTEYVTHDFEIGTPELKGILLYGLNSSGKSSMMKALGLSVIMAQAGMFVPADEFIYSPYHTLMTRISCNDNFFKALSSFSVEMIELKSIWKHSDQFTLVIGDELCQSTESNSSNVIVAATLIKLSRQNTSFIFATHLHEIVKFPEIKAIKTIQPFHLSVIYDESNDKLIFNRKLERGTCEPIYGITVSKFIIQDKEFNELTTQLRNTFSGTSGLIVEPKQSKYNPNVFVDHCMICNKKLEVVDGNVNLDTHHINYQVNCENGVVKDKKYLSKNSKANLIVICKNCHRKIHNGEIKIDDHITSFSLSN